MTYILKRKVKHYPTINKTKTLTDDKVELIAKEASLQSINMDEVKVGETDTLRDTIEKQGNLNSVIIHRENKGKKQLTNNKVYNVSDLLTQL